MKSRFPLPRTLAASIAVCLAAGAVVVDNSWAAPALKPQAGQPAQAGTQRYIVRFTEPALAAYNHSLRTSNAKSLGGVGQIPMRVKANGRAQLDAQSHEAKAYIAELGQKQAQHQREIESAIGRQVQTIRTFRHALNGAVMTLSPLEADKVARLSGVASISPDRARALADDVSTRFIGANAVWLGGPASDTLPGYTFPTIESLYGQLNSNFGGFKGDGIVVGDIDTGYNSLSPSFQATDSSGYAITNPLGSGHYLGDCNVTGISLGGCNNKVIGVYDEVSVQYYGDAAARRSRIRRATAAIPPARSRATRARAGSRVSTPFSPASLRTRTSSSITRAPPIRCSARIRPPRVPSIRPSRTVSSTCSIIRSAAAIVRGTTRSRRRSSTPSSRASSSRRPPAIPVRASRRRSPAPRTTSNRGSPPSPQRRRPVTSRRCTCR